MFIQTEVTPNPDSLKFMPGRDVLGSGIARDFRSFREAQASPLAKRLFQMDGVVGVREPAHMRGSLQPLTTVGRAVAGVSGERLCDSIEDGGV